MDAASAVAVTIHHQISDLIVAMIEHYEQWTVCDSPNGSP